MRGAVKVRDAMTANVLTIRPEASLKEAATALAGQPIGGLPVIDPGGAVVGVVTDADIVLKEGASRRGGPAPPVPPRRGEGSRGEGRSADGRRGDEYAGDHRRCAAVGKRHALCAALGSGLAAVGKLDVVGTRCLARPMRRWGISRRGGSGPGAPVSRLLSRFATREPPIQTKDACS